MRVAYIGKKEEQFADFLEIAVDSEAFKVDDIVDIPPESNIDDMLDEIFSEKVDGVILGYNLGEDNSRINYTGLDLLKQIQRQRHGFPCVVVASSLSQVLEEKEKESSWRIFDIEDVLNNPNNFFKRLGNEIAVFKQKIDDSMKECSRLYDKLIEGDINAMEYQEFLDKSAFLESAMIGDGRLPESLLQKGINPFLKLIEKANKLIAEIETTEQQISSNKGAVLTAGMVGGIESLMYPSRKNIGPFAKFAMAGNAPVVVLRETKPQIFPTHIDFGISRAEDVDLPEHLSQEDIDQMLESNERDD